MFAAAILKAIGSATKPSGEACLCLALGSKVALSMLITQEDKAAAAAVEDKVAAARKSYQPKTMTLTGIFTNDNLCDSLCLLYPSLLK